MEELLWIFSGIIIMIIAGIVMDQSFNITIKNTIGPIDLPQLIVGILLFLEGFWIYKLSGI